jgi:hypothetical protein
MPGFFAYVYFEDALRKGFAASLQEAKDKLGRGPRISSRAIFISSQRDEELVFRA